MPMKRPAPWQARRIATAKALRARAPCDYTPGCTGKAMGVIVRPLGNGDVDWVLACVKCAAEAKQAERARAAAPRET
jgi:hypothetical protein